MAFGDMAFTVSAYILFDILKMENLSIADNTIEGLHSIELHANVFVEKSFFCRPKWTNGNVMFGMFEQKRNASVMKKSRKPQLF